MNQTGVAIVKMSALRPAQRSLYELIIAKLDKDEKITLEEARDIWLRQVHSNVRDGIPYGQVYNYWMGSTHYPGTRDTPMDEEEITFAVLNWLMKNIGLLVIRGYLKVIPMVSMEQLTDA